MTAELLLVAQLALARQLESPSVMSNFIDRVSGLGYNAVHFYCTGRVETPTWSLPEGERYSEREVRDLVGYATAKGVKVIPYVEIYGHGDLFFGDPALSRFCEDQKGEPRLKGTKQVFCLADPAARSFLVSYMRDLKALFGCREMNVGLDEVWNMGTCPECRAKDDRGELFREAVMFYHDTLKSLGVRMWMWDDFFIYHPGTLEKLPRDIVMCHWDYDPDVSDRGTRDGFTGRRRRDWLAEYERLGFDVISCCYNDPGNLVTLHRYSRRHRSAGFMVTFWPEMRNTFLGSQMPLLAAAALTARNPAKYASRDVYPDAVGLVLPSLNTEERLAAATTMLLKPGRTDVSSAVALLEKRLSAEVPDDPLGEAGILDDFVARAKTGVLKRRFAAIERVFTDVRRTKEEIAAAKPELAALRSQVAALAERRARQWTKWRNGLPYGNSGKMQTAAEPLKTLVGKIDGLLTAPETPAAADERRLRLVFSSPDWYGRNLWKVSGRFADGWKVLADGDWIPGNGEWAIFERGFTFRAKEFPTELRIEERGYGRAHLAFAAVESARGWSVPVEVLGTTGAVERPENLLADDFETAVFNVPGFLEKFHHRADPEAVSSVTLKMNGEE